MDQTLTDKQYLMRAYDLAQTIVGTTSPNPWVGAVLVTADGRVFEGTTAPNRGRHAEAAALEAAGDAAKGAIIYCTLEPCANVGFNPACCQLLIDAGVSRVVTGMVDPDERTNGVGLDRLRKAGIDTTVLDLGGIIERQLAPFIKHRRTGRPFVWLKLAMTLDGRIAAPDSTSKWITGAAARENVHKLRSQCDAIIVGAGTVRADNPSLTVRLNDEVQKRQPLRVVLGNIPEDAKVNPAMEWKQGLSELLDELGKQGCLQVMVEGGARTAGDFHRAGLIDRYAFYYAPALMGGEDSIPAMSGNGASTITEAMRGRLVDVQRLGEDVRIDFEPINNPTQQVKAV